MLEFNKQLNAALVDPGFIARVRKKLPLDQRQAAAIFGGGPNAFSRYESGKTKPPLALVKLLILLDCNATQTDAIIYNPLQSPDPHPLRRIGTAPRANSSEMRISRDIDVMHASSSAFPYQHPASRPGLTDSDPPTQPLSPSMRCRCLS
jgi:transcriptional regulator with XRE-family HTH domain